MHPFLLAMLALMNTITAVDSAEVVFTVETDYVRWEIGSDGTTISFRDKVQEQELFPEDSHRPLSHVVVSGVSVPSTKAEACEGGYVLHYGDSGVEAVFEVESQASYFTLIVKEVRGDNIDSLGLIDIPLTLTGKAEEATTACMLATNLQTRVPGIPSPVSRITGDAVSRFGLEGASLHILVCPQEKLRQVMKTAVANSPELPKHLDDSYPPIGGPFALDATTNRGSYLFDFGTLTEETVDEWIALAQQLGFTQIDFHTGTSLRFGDLTPNEKLFPKGRESVKAVIDKLHDAGIAAGLHTYAFFIAKNSPYVTPVPDPRLGKDDRFTLAVSLGQDDESVVVEESLSQVKIDTGFFARNSVTLQIDDELIVFSGVTQEAPFTFTGCKRGAHGTAVTEHAPGTPVHKLKECFGLFCPDGDSTLFPEIAAVTADTFNECGFDMIYLDALDGSDVLAGGEHAWHYAPKFTFEIARRLKRPALFEMSTMGHHLWFVRARMGAWDHPARSHKRFIDLHCEINQNGSPMFLPMNLGWWAVKTWQDGIASAWSEPTWSDDIEYLLCKALGNDYSLSLMGVNPDNLPEMPAFQRLIPLFHDYEKLRLSGRVPESIKEQLRIPGAEYVLKKEEEKFQFHEAAAHKHIAHGAQGDSLKWTVDNTFEEQTVRVRIETLLSPAPYDSEEGIVLNDFSDASLINLQRFNEGVTGTVTVEQSTLKENERMGVFTLENTREEAVGSWVQLGTSFTEPLNAKDKAALGCWVHGDGSGALLNLQTLSAAHTTAGGTGDHYVPLDFTGWRYVSLVEFESGEIPRWLWPYGNHYSIYREHVDFSALQSFSVWFNNLPPGKEVRCALSPVKALPLESSVLRKPTLLINGEALSFNVEIPTGSCLEYDPASGTAVLYDKKGNELEKIDVAGEVTLKGGVNTLELNLPDSEEGLPPRARITLLCEGQALQE